MKDSHKTVARQCIEGAENNTLTFPQTVKSLMEAGFEGYTVDLRRATRIHYLPCGESLELAVAPPNVSVGEAFNADAIKGAIKEAQMQVHGFTYKGFCDKVAAAGCAGYMVSFSGRRVVYYGRTGDVHVEFFPQ